jgi:hypothetical protein
MDEIPPSLVILVLGNAWSQLAVAEEVRVGVSEGLAIAERPLTKHKNVCAYLTVDARDDWKRKFTCLEQK